MKPKVSEIKELVLIRSWRSGIDVFFDWLLIAFNFFLVIQFPHPIVYVACFILAARHQLALAVLMHDGSHRRLAKSGIGNDLIAQFFCAAPLFFSMYSYQKLHMRHHKNPLAPDDPDLTLTGGYPIPKSSLIRKLVRDALGISYFKFIVYFLYRPRRKVESGKIIENEKVSTKGGKLGLPVIFFSIALVNLTMLGVLWNFGHPWTYFFFWVLPMITALQVLLRIRGITEHAGYQQNEDQRLNARTVVNPLQTFFFAPHNVNYHIEHHVFPAVPYYNLPRVHQKFMADNVIPKANLYRGYGQVLRELVTD